MTLIIKEAIGYAVTKLDERHSTDPAVATRSYCLDLLKIVHSERFFLALAPRHHQAVFADDSVTKILQQSPTFIYSPHIALAGDISCERLLEAATGLVCPRDFQLRNNTLVDDEFVVHLCVDVLGATLEKFSMDHGCSKITCKAFLEVVRRAPRNTALRWRTIGSIMWQIIEPVESSSETSEDVARRYYRAGAIQALIGDSVDQQLGDDNGRVWVSALDVVARILQFVDATEADTAFLCKRLEWLFALPDLQHVRDEALYCLYFLMKDPADLERVSPLFDIIFDSGVAANVVGMFGEAIREPSSSIQAMKRIAFAIQKQNSSSDGENCDTDEEVQSAKRLISMRTDERHEDIMLEKIMRCITDLVQHLHLRQRFSEARELLRVGDVIRAVCDFLRTVSEYSQETKTSPFHPALVATSHLICVFAIDHPPRDATLTDEESGDYTRTVVAAMLKVARLCMQYPQPELEPVRFGGPDDDKYDFPTVFVHMVRSAMCYVAHAPFGLYLFIREEQQTQRELLAEALQKHGDVTHEAAVTTRLDALDFVVEQLGGPDAFAAAILGMLRIARRCEMSGVDDQSFPFSNVSDTVTEIACAVLWVFDVQKNFKPELPPALQRRVDDAAAMLQMHLIEKPTAAIWSSASLNKRDLCMLLSPRVPRRMHAPVTELADLKEAIHKNEAALTEDDD